MAVRQDAGRRIVRVLDAAAHARAQGREFVPRSWLDLVERQSWILVSLYAIGIFLISLYVLPVIGMPGIRVYLIQPLLWLSAAGLVLYLARRDPAAGNPLAVNRWIIGTAVVLGLLTIALTIIAALMLGFGNSPYSHTPYWMGLNVWFIATALIGQEFVRWHVLTRLSRFNPVAAFAFAWGLIFVISIPLARYEMLTSSSSSFSVLGSFILPAAGEGMLATYICAAGGPLASIAYLGTMALFEWLSPVLPNLPWSAAAFVGILAPLFGLTVFQEVQANLAADADDALEEETVAIEEESRLGTGMVIVLAAAMFLFWFNLGVFGVQPALTTGISMEPTLHQGDLAVIEQVDATTDIEIGDIVYFEQYGVGILHRVIDIREEEGEQFYITQGDNNDLPDDPVRPEQIIGEMVVKLPKIGWIPIAAKGLVGMVR